MHASTVAPLSSALVSFVRWGIEGTRPGEIVAGG
jgi:hypothetical protein